MALGTMINSTRRNLALLGVRAAVGAVLVAHGWQKLHDWGLEGTRSSFADMGVPNAGPAAAFAIAAELGGGALLLIGLLTPLAALLVVADMAGAFWFVHRGTDVFVGDGGWELVAAIGAAALALFAVGAGALSLDAIFVGAWRRRRARKARLKPAKQVPAPTHNVLGEALHDEVGTTV
ncbi:DoxX family protein [Nocardioides jejuensis]|uniref:DoxX family protein n=1 Tax=Nocardioides jejuensis TaxID=2502782 RepID=UPI001A9E3D3C|nr:DoxX family protein [Nocardioides jejuensis]